MSELKNGVARRRRRKPLAKLAMKLVGELLISTLLMLIIAAIEIAGHAAIAWLVAHGASHWLGLLLEFAANVVALLDVICYLWVVVTSIGYFMREVR